MSLSFSLILLLHEFTIYYFWRMVCCLRFPPLSVYYWEYLALFLSQRLFLSNSVIRTIFVCFYVFIMNCVVTRRVRIANQVVMDSCCRGGIVNIRCG